MKSVTIALVGLIFFGCEIAAIDTFAGPPLSGSVQQRRIATVSPAAEVLISDDLAHVAVIDRHGQKQRLTVDGKDGPESDALRFVEHDGPPFDRGGIPVLYARADRGRWRLVSNGVLGPECDAWINLTSGGTDRTTIAYTAIEISRKAFVAIDGQPGPIYADVSCPTLSPDRTRIAYVACTGKGRSASTSWSLTVVQAPHTTRSPSPHRATGTCSARTASTPRVWPDLARNGE